MLCRFHLHMALSGVNISWTNLPFKSSPDLMLSLFTQFIKAQVDALWTLVRVTSTAKDVTVALWVNKNPYFGLKQFLFLPIFHVGRDLVWTPKNRRPDKLRDLIKEVEVGIMKWFIRRIPINSITEYVYIRDVRSYEWHIGTRKCVNIACKVVRVIVNV